MLSNVILLTLAAASLSPAKVEMTSGGSKVAGIGVTGTPDSSHRASSHHAKQEVISDVGVRYGLSPDILRKMTTPPAKNQSAQPSPSHSTSAGQTTPTARHVALSSSSSSSSSSKKSPGWHKREVLS